MRKTFLFALIVLGVMFVLPLGPSLAHELPVNLTQTQNQPAREHMRVVLAVGLGLPTDATFGDIGYHLVMKSWGIQAKATAEEIGSMKIRPFQRAIDVPAFTDALAGMLEGNIRAKLARQYRLPGNIPIYEMGQAMLARDFGLPLRATVEEIGQVSIEARQNWIKRDIGVSITTPWRETILRLLVNRYRLLQTATWEDVARMHRKQNTQRSEGGS